MTTTTEAVLEQTTQVLGLKVSRKAAELIEHWVLGPDTMGQKRRGTSLRFITHTQMSAQPIPGETRFNGTPLYALSVWVNLTFQPRPNQPELPAFVMKLLELARV